MTKILKICLCMLAITPLIVDNSLFYSSTTTESVFIRGILLLMSLLFLFNFLYTKKFRIKIIEKVKIIIRNPLVISVLIFFSIFIISTIFAVDKYSAFWGTIERAEGLVGMIYFLSFFIFVLLIFEKKDWLWFFRLSLLVTFALIFKEFMQFFSGVNRPDSFLGNPTFLSGYLLFSIFSAIVVFSEIKSSFWKYFSVIIFLLSILGIFITETRGTIAGLAVGFIVILIYAIIKGKNVSFWNFNLRKLSIFILCLAIAFSALFFSTRGSEVWQRIPGFGRVAVINGEDNTTQTRLLMAKLSIDAVDPAKNGAKEFLVGWGPENFSLAYLKYFNPKQFQYEVGWFDRSHNKLFDILVMTGVFGLLAYLSIYFFFFKSIFKWQDFSLLNIGLLFFGISLLIHLLFVFDQVTTSIPFFILLAFSIYLTALYDITKEIDKLNKDYKVGNPFEIFASIFLLILTLFLSFVFFKNDLPAYIQLKSYASLREKSDVTIISNKINEVFEPFTTAQMKIRYDFLSFISKNYDAKSESIVKLSDLSFLKGDEYMNKRPLDLQFSNFLALTYTSQGKELNNPEYLKRGEEIFKRILILSPHKPDFNYGLALSWFYQKKYTESFIYFEKIFDTNPGYFSQKNKGPEGVYTLFIKHFYEVKDKENFIKTAKRLKENNYTDSVTLDKIIDFINKNNIWPNINFNQ
ncbi:MAG: O-antigen ligase family protein [Candidatus Paceibacterota bacterium]|jgi:putative inorganic carbon (HCO3(-)) transporter